MDLMTYQNETSRVEHVLNQRVHFVHPSGKMFHCKTLEKWSSIKERLESDSRQSSLTGTNNLSGLHLRK